MNFDIRIDEPLVSVLVVTYNHAPYIRQCLDSLLMQETSFPYEICVGEDESTDGTREICIEYADCHPDRIKLVLHSQSQPGREEYCAQGNFNYLETLKHCRGKYIADCDGDDLWLDPLKLQKQCDVLEQNPSICLVHSDYEVIDKDSMVLMQWDCGGRDCSRTETEDRDAFINAILSDTYHIRTCTVVMRTSAIWEALAVCAADLKKIPMADIPMWCEVLRLGEAVYLPEPMAAYRSLAESACNSDSPCRKARFVNQAADWGVMFGQRYDLPMKALWENKIKSCNRYALMSGEYGEMRRLHAAHAEEFPLMEKVIYWAGHILPLRKLLMWHYIRTYRSTQKLRSCITSAGDGDLADPPADDPSEIVNSLERRLED